jgi:hypothetical protein
MSLGRIQGGGAHPARAPLKIGKNMIFLAYNRDFSHKIPRKFSRLPPLGAIFVRTPPNLKSWIRPCVPSSVRVVILIRPVQEADTSLDGLYPTTEKLDHSSIFRDSQGMNNTCTISNSVISVSALTWLIGFLYDWNLQFLRKELLFKLKFISLGHRWLWPILAILFRPFMFHAPKDSFILQLGYFLS